jgi:hypothetical protein
LSTDEAGNDLTYRIIGAGMAVHNSVGPGTRRKSTNGRWLQSSIIGKSSLNGSTQMCMKMINFRPAFKLGPHHSCIRAVFVDGQLRR